MKVAVYAGSFDPITLGHWDILKRAGEQFDKVVVVVAYNPKKNGLFDPLHRMGLVAEMIADNLGGLSQDYTRYEISPVLETDPKFTVCCIDNTHLVVNVARKFGAQALVRGLRSITDFDDEFKMALVNRKLAPDIETVFFITAHEYLYVASSTVREIASLHGCLDGFVSQGVRRELDKKFPV